MNIDQITSQLSGMENYQAQNIQGNISMQDLNNPQRMLNIQKWSQEYSIEVGFHSAMIKMVKDLLTGIVSNIS